MDGAKCNQDAYLWVKTQKTLWLVHTNACHNLMMYLKQVWMNKCLIIRISTSTKTHIIIYSIIRERPFNKLQNFLLEVWRARLLFFLHILGQLICFYELSRHLFFLEKKTSSLKVKWSTLYNSSCRDWTQVVTVPWPKDACKHSS